MRRIEQRTDKHGNPVWEFDVFNDFNKRLGYFKPTVNGPRFFAADKDTGILTHDMEWIVEEMRHKDIDI